MVSLVPDAGGADLGIDCRMIRDADAVGRLVILGLEFVDLDEGAQLGRSGDENEIDGLSFYASFRRPPAVVFGVKSGGHLVLRDVVDRMESSSGKSIPGHCVSGVHKPLRPEYVVRIA